MPKMFSPSTMFLKLCFARENVKKPASKVAKPAQIQPKPQFLFHKNIPQRDFSIMTSLVLEQSRNFPSEKWRKTVVFFVCLTFIRAYDTIILMNRVDIWLNYLFLFHWEICTTILLHSKGQKFWQFFCSYFGRNDDFINSFWNLLTFSGLGQVWKIWL